MNVTGGLIILGAFAAFAVIHSVTAGTLTKRHLSKILPKRLVEGWYRLAYNAFSVVTILPVMILMLILPDQVLYSITIPLSYLLRMMQLAGVVGLTWTLLSIDLLRFAGLRQAQAFLAGDPLPLADEKLKLDGVYSISRHPLYLFTLVALWFTPLVTLNNLSFNIAATVYFIIGSLVEERRLERTFGDQYRAYQGKVAWLIPGIRIP